MATLDYIVTFSSSNLALKAESLLNKAGVRVRLVAAPRSISSECGFCLLLERLECSNLAEKLETLGAVYAGIFTKKQIDGVTEYEQQA
ncbi:DUF3343 domain-containing protein [Vibrio sp. JC009]|uniref:DUF3343 domain-containing protein n=1 Tax=Vibrio sp. JC009 TaxID=2912314 RepID=UPI0023B18B54|nr:DUF3343 domain-containing protein [Vibrio sp. JC009]WED23776.1 DUF3343 domain-containing protein [Vibrio sp. JC009]